LKNIKNLLKKGGKRVSELKEEYKILPAARDNIKIKFILEELLKYSKIEIDSTLLTFIQEKSLPKTALDSPKWELLILKILKFLTFYWTRLSTFIA
jgi:FKBP-type peptidyl-prolyl cis-trans isomerase (trigger factor)